MQMQFVWQWRRMRESTTLKDVLVAIAVASPGTIQESKFRSKLGFDNCKQMFKLETHSDCDKYMQK
jgi:hypothetical protein